MPPTSGKAPFQAPKKRRYMMPTSPKCVLKILCCSSDSRIRLRFVGLGFVVVFERRAPAASICLVVLFRQQVLLKLLLLLLESPM